ncbi:MAG: two-component system response regulator, partial [Treponemataceae bacterium]|nr:two-component system response regulator [Treponemataceae bacterium]
RQIFIEASKSNNENMDGTGYPKGLEGTLIPQIARLIHVAESYTALVSRRSYRAIHDKESAIEEMKSKPGLYDPDVVAVLDAIV